MPDIVVTTLAQYGLPGALVLVLGWVIYKVGLRMIAALDRVVEKLDEHTKTDIEAHAAVREELIALRTRVDTIADITPIEPFRKPAPSQVYGIHRRGGTKPGGDDNDR